MSGGAEKVAPGFWALNIKELSLVSGYDSVDLIKLD